MSKKTITYLSIIIIVIGSIFLANGLILAWTAPTQSPPAGNASAPINVGSTGQSKEGNLEVKGILRGSGSVKFDDYDSCTALETDADGDLVCGIDDEGVTSDYGRSGVSSNLYLASQRLYGDNSSALYWYGRHDTVTQMLFYDKQNTLYGRVFGSGNGANFGLLDGDGNWSYLAAKDSYTQFRINDSAKMTIKSSGKVGIGTASPGAQLDIGGANTNRDLLAFSYTPTSASIGKFSYSITAPYPLTLTLASRPFAIMGGRVGIGTTNPSKILHIYDPVNANPAIRVQSDTTGSGVNDGMLLEMGDDLSALVWNYEAGKLRFGTSGTERMTILSNGKVGIGTASPDHELTIQQGDWGNYQLFLKQVNANHGYVLRSSGWDGDLSFSRKIDGSITETVRFKANGNVGIGTTNPAAKLQIIGGSAHSGISVKSNKWGVSAKGGNPSGCSYPSTSEVGVFACGDDYDFYAGGGWGTKYGSGSSIRWKRNITEIDNALDKVLNLRGVYFDWDEEHGGQHDMGMVAEEVGEYIPEIVVYEDDGVYATGMDYGALTPVLVEAIKELKTEKDVEIEQLKTQIEALEKIICELKPDAGLCNH